MASRVKPPPRRPQVTRPRSGRGGLVFASFGTLVVGALAGLGAARWTSIVAAVEDMGSTPLRRLDSYVRVPLAHLPAIRIPGSELSKTIYLNREGARLIGGADDAAKNQAALVRLAGRDYADIPAFAGSAATWNAFVKCVRGKFAPFDVQVVDQRPTSGGYIMAMVGGTPADLDGPHPQAGKHTHSRSTGLAPFTGSPISEAVVLVFARTLRESPNALCETASMEIAHAYGLDHAYDCRDLMTYRPHCGVKRFLDKDVPCGETAPRPCAGGQATQNSFQLLTRWLGSAEPRQR